MECSLITAPGEKLTESEMIVRIMQGESEWVDVLFQPYDVRARSIARRFLHGDESRIEDVVQEATMKAYMNLNKLRNSQRFGSWFLTIVRNLAIDLAKRENLFIDKPYDSDEWDFETWVENRTSKSIEPSEYANRNAMAETLKHELSVLDRIYGEPICMLYFEDKSYNEIAEILNKPLGTVKSLIHRGKAILKGRIYRDATATA